MVIERSRNFPAWVGGVDRYSARVSSSDCSRKAIVCQLGVPIADGPKTTFSPLQLSDPQVLICQRADRMLPSCPATRLFSSTSSQQPCCSTSGVPSRHHLHGQISMRNNPLSEKDRPWFATYNSTLRFSMLRCRLHSPGLPSIALTD